MYFIIGHIILNKYKKYIKIWKLIIFRNNFLIKGFIL